MLGCPVDVVDESAAVDALVALVERRRNDPAQPGGLVVTLNPEMVMRARRDHEFRATLETAALLVPDGIGVVRALRRRGHPQATRVGGADMLMSYLPEAVRRHHRVAIAGAGPGVAAVAGQRLRAQFPGLEIVATDSGDPDEALARRLSDAQPDMVWAAFGAGKQELFLRRHLERIGAGAGVGVGGTLDYIAGRVPRAPRTVRNAGLEWAWRLAREPWRLRRQLQLPRFWMLERLEHTRSNGDAE
ncbi:MAG: WecB/TagA/CpsF family glycosyltransferase [Candidatus Dormibacteraeota bacterium]|nr:WecB/TagA/CpsF family glycosyltransferase [Candidatus Dormibacteraeota bacterium]